MTNSKKKLDKGGYDVTKDPVIITLAALTAIIFGEVAYLGFIKPTLEIAPYIPAIVKETIRLNNLPERKWLYSTNYVFPTNYTAQTPQVSTNDSHLEKKMINYVRPFCHP